MNKNLLTIGAIGAAVLVSTNSFAANYAWPSEDLIGKRLVFGKVREHFERGGFSSSDTDYRYYREVGENTYTTYQYGANTESVHKYEITESGDLLYYGTDEYRNNDRDYNSGSSYAPAVKHFNSAKTEIGDTWESHSQYTTYDSNQNPTVKGTVYRFFEVVDKGSVATPVATYNDCISISYQKYRSWDNDYEASYIRTYCDGYGMIRWENQASYPESYVTYNYYQHLEGELINPQEFGDGDAYDEYRYSDKLLLDIEDISEHQDRAIGGFDRVELFNPKQVSPVNEKRGLMVLLPGYNTRQGYSNYLHRSTVLGVHGLPQLAREHGMVIAVPEPNDGDTVHNCEGTDLDNCWDNYPGEGEDLNREFKSYAHIFSMVEELLADESMNIDPDQVYVAGHLSGALMAYNLGCMAPDVFAGVGMQYIRKDAGGLEGSVAEEALACQEMAGENAADLGSQVAVVAFGEDNSFIELGYAKDMAQVYATLTSDVIDTESEWVEGLSRDLCYGIDFSCTKGVTIRNQEKLENIEAVETLSTNGKVAFVNLWDINTHWSRGMPGLYTGSNYGSSNSINIAKYYAEFFSKNNARAVRTPKLALSGTPENQVDEGVEYTFEPVIANPNEETLTFTAKNLPVWAEIDSATGVVSGTPLFTDARKYQNIQIIAEGSKGGRATLPLFEIEVADVNQLPELTSEPPLEVKEGSEYCWAIEYTDVDNDRVIIEVEIPEDVTWLRYTTSWENCGGRSSSRTIIGTPPVGSAGVFEGITITLNDGNHDEPASLIFDITVTAPNKAPEFADIPAQEIAENSEFVLDLSEYATDENILDQDKLTYSVSEELPLWAALDGTTGIISGTPASDDVGVSEAITVTVTDPDGESATTAFTITVVEVNDPPVISGEPATAVVEGELYTSPVSATDPEGDALVYTISGNPEWLTIDSATGVVSGTPIFSGSDLEAEYVFADIVVTATESDTEEKLSASLPAFAITVNVNNRAPVIGNTPVTMAEENKLYTYSLNATDANKGDVLSYVITKTPSWAAFDAMTGTLSGTPSAEDVGTTEEITITVTDVSGASDSVVFKINVTDVNDAPVINAMPEGGAKEGIEYAAQVIAVDPEAQPLTFALSGNPAWMTIDAATGAISGTPGFDAAGSSTVTVTVTDPLGLSAQDTFDIAVENTNRAPVFGDVVAVESIDEGADYGFSAVATDADGEALTYTIINNPAWMVIDAATGAVSGNPEAEDIGVTEGVVIEVTDGVETASVEFDVEVVDINRVPVITGTPAANVLAGAEFIFTPGATDIDSETLVYSIENQPEWAEFDAETGTLSGTPDTSFAGVYPGIVISVSDGENTVSLPSFDITVAEEQEVENQEEDENSGGGGSMGLLLLAMGMIAVTRRRFRGQLLACKSKNQRAALCAALFQFQRLLWGVHEKTNLFAAQFALIYFIALSGCNLGAQSTSDPDADVIGIS